MFTNSHQRNGTGHGKNIDSLASAATSYVHRGWSLIPLTGKQPSLAAWKEFQTRLPSAAEMTEWFTGRRPQPTGIGVITGSLSGLVVVDCDTSEDAAYWLRRFPCSPLMVETGRGGLHIYYAVASNEVIRNRVKLFGRPIDIRGEGGYVAAPPSRHPSGKYYRWTAASSTLHQFLPPFELRWLQDELPAPPRTTETSLVTFRNITAYIRRIHAKSGQGGHCATFRAACKLRDAGLSAEDALTLLTDWNKSNAHPPWSDMELLHKINSAYQVGGDAMDT